MDLITNYDLIDKEFIIHADDKVGYVVVIIDTIIKGIPAKKMAFWCPIKPIYYKIKKQTLPILARLSQKNNMYFIDFKELKEKEKNKDKLARIYKKRQRMKKIIKVIE